MIDAQASALAAECWRSLAERQQWTQGTPNYGKPDAEHVLLGVRILSYVVTQMRADFRDAADVLAAMDAAADEMDRSYECMFPGYEPKRRRQP